jgi:CHAT domain-containing protein/tetratricopeptide (TPR) repeat protein
MAVCPEAQDLFPRPEPDHRRVRALACVLTLVAAAWLAADEPSAEQTLAAELLAQPDAAARELWLESHQAQVTPALGREAEAQSRVLLHAGKYPEAIAGFTSTVRVGEIAADPSSRIRALHGLAEAERIQGRLPECVALLNRALEDAQQAGDQAALARLNGTLGLVQLSLGEYGGALAIFERQRVTFEALADLKGRGQAESNIGIALGTIGRYAEAADAFERSRQLFEASGYTSGIPRAYNNLGRAHFNLGNYGLALEELSRSLELKQAAGNSSELPSTLKGIGEVHLAQGAPERALDSFERAYARAAEVGQKPEMAQALEEQGQALLALERPRDALAILQRALTLAQEAQEATTIGLVSATLAEVYLALGERAPALRLIESGLETAQRTGELAPRARLFRALATLRLDEGQAAEALALARRGADSARECGTPDELWPALLVAGRAQRALRHPAEAEAALREAVDVIEDLRAQAVGPDTDRAAFLTSRAAPYQELVALLAESERPWEAFAVAERSKGRVLLDVLAGGRTSIAAALSEQERSQERELESAVLIANAELRDLLPRSERDAARVTRLQAQRSARRIELEDFRAHAYAAHPELRVLRGESPPLQARDLRPLLENGTLLLEYALTARSAYLFAVSADAAGQPVLAVHRIELASDVLVRQARDLRARLAARDLDFARPAEQLYAALVAPAAAAVRRARRLVVVPDGPLWDLPFQALRPAGGRYLIEQLPISYAPSLSVLRDMHVQRVASVHSGANLLAIGNPALGPGAARRAPAAFMDAPLAPLPQAEAQVRGIARLYDPGTTAVRVGSAARESWLKAQASHYRILHFATHGVLDDASPLYSALVLAAPVAGEHDDGLLEAREILGLDLHADLAVLSACETGRGLVGAGEGLIGTTWAFFVAGCPTTVASQWKVEAASTNRLMLAFHRELRRGRTPAEALRLAALAQLRLGQRHPFYWAGFVAVGDAYGAGGWRSRRAVMKTSPSTAARSAPHSKTVGGALRK